MKKMLFGLIATVMLSVSGFANSEIIKTEKSIFVENCDNKFKATFDLGNLTNLSEMEMSNLFDNLPSQIVNSELFSECTISYSVTFTFMGVSSTVTSSGTAATCTEAGNIARNGIKNETSKAKALIADMF